MSKRAVFLDRDGTIIEDVGFVRRVEDVKLLPQAAQAIAKLNGAGWAVVVVTNQSGVARGLHTEQDVAATNQRMTDLLKRQHARLDAIYYCPHLPEGKVPEYAVVCNCRKPRPGMILQAATDLDIDLARSVMIGDAPRDVEAGLAAGTRAVLLTQSAMRAERLPDACGQAADLTTAVDEILSMEAAAPAPEVVAPAPIAAPEPEPAPVVEPAVEPAVEPPVEPPPAEEPRDIPIRPAQKEFVPEPEPEKKKSRPRAKEKTEAPEPPPTPAPAPAPAPEEPAAKAEAPTAPATQPACGRCGRGIRPGDVEAGRAFGRDGVFLCEACASGLVSRRRVEKEPSNEEVLRELQSISRALSFRHFSMWHVMGAVAQALAIGILVGGQIMHPGVEGLLWAIFFQLLALTLFVLGRM